MMQPDEQLAPKQLLPPSKSGKPVWVEKLAENPPTSVICEVSEAGSYLARAFMLSDFIYWYFSPTLFIYRLFGSALGIYN